MAACGRMAMEAGDFRLATQCFMAAWEEDSLHGPQADLLLTLDTQRRILPRTMVTPLEEVRRYWRHPEQAGCIDDEALLHRELANEPDALFLRQALLTLLCAQGRMDEALEQVAALPPLEGIEARVEADVRLLRGEYDRAAELYAAFIGHMGRTALYTSHLRLALCQHGADPRDESGTGWRATLEGLLRRAPWHTHARQLQHDWEQTADEGAAQPLMNVPVCIPYYYDTDGLDATLADLAATDCGTIHVLGHGPGVEVLAAWADRLGERLHIEQVPVPLGQPASRNWLLALEGVRKSEHALFVVGGTRVSSDLLQRLGRSVSRHPHAAVWGTTVVDAAAPQRILAADHHVLTPQADAPACGNLFTPRFVLHSYDSINFGQLAHVRTCDHVDGCCQLLHMPTALEVPFDLRFTTEGGPRAGEDAARSLRLRLAGHTVLHDGRITVQAPCRPPLDPANHLKLDGLLTSDDVARLLEGGNHP